MTKTINHCGHTVYGSDDPGWKSGIIDKKNIMIFGHDLIVTYKTTDKEGCITLELIEFLDLSNELVQRFTAEAWLHIELLVEEIVKKIGYEVPDIDINYGFQGHRKGAKE